MRAIMTTVQTDSDSFTLLAAVGLSAVLVGSMLFAVEAEASEKSRARQALEQAGYKNIRDESTSIMGCSKGDSMITSRKFLATAPNGYDGPVRVCCSLFFRGCDIRTNGW